MSILIGSLQGITEFLPISSSAHTIILYHYLEIKNIDIIFLQVIVHFGTLCAILIYFRKRLLCYVFALYNFFLLKKRDPEVYGQLRIIKYLLLATIPLAIFGFLFEGYIENALHQKFVIPFTLLIGGLIFLIIDKYSSNLYTKLKDLTFKNTFLIGISQVFALIPGVSRSGITIITGMSLGLSRQLAAEFTFFLAIPTLAGVTLKKFIDLSSHNFQSGELSFYIMSFLSSFVIGFFAIKFLLQFLQNHSLKVFGWYRIALAIILLFIF